MTRIISNGYCSEVKEKNVYKGTLNWAITRKQNGKFVYIFSIDGPKYDKSLKKLI